VQPNYNPEVGFIDRVDLATNFADVTVSPRPKRGPIRELNFEAFVTRQHDTHGVLQTQEWQTTFRANFHNGAYTDNDIVDNFIQRLTTPFNIFAASSFQPGCTISTGTSLRTVPIKANASFTISSSGSEPTTTVR